MRMLWKVMTVSALLVLAVGFSARGQTAAEIEAYPIDFCIVTGQKLGSMGPIVDHMHEGRLVRFCCTGCLAAFRRDPARYLAELDKHAVEAGPAAETPNPSVAPTRPHRRGCC